LRAVFRAVDLRAVLVRAVDFRAALFRAVLLRAVDFRAVLLRAVDFRAVLFRAVLFRDVDPPDRLRDEDDERERDLLVVDERLRALLARRREPPLVARWLRGISARTRSLTSCGISRSR
jgi:hypothetical protein